MCPCGCSRRVSFESVSLVDSNRSQLWRCLGVVVERCFKITLMFQTSYQPWSMCKCLWSFTKNTPPLSLLYEMLSVDASLWWESNREMLISVNWFFLETTLERTFGCCFQSRGERPFSGGTEKKRSGTRRGTDGSWSRIVRRLDGWDRDGSTLK